MDGNLSTTDEAIRLTRTVRVTPAVLWALLTQNAHIHHWWGNHVSLQPHVGGSFRETWSNGDRMVTTSGTVLEAVPPSRLVLAWSDDDWPETTRLMLTIAAQTGNASHLELVHDGWEIFQPGRRARLLADHVAGWQHHLTNLSAYAEARTEDPDGTA